MLNPKLIIPGRSEKVFGAGIDMDGEKPKKFIDNRSVGEKVEQDILARQARQAQVNEEAAEAALLNPKVRAGLHAAAREQLNAIDENDAFYGDGDYARGLKEGNDRRAYLAK